MKGLREGSKVTVKLDNGKTFDGIIRYELDDDNEYLIRYNGESNYFLERKVFKRVPKDPIIRILLEVLDD